MCCRYYIASEDDSEELAQIISILRARGLLTIPLNSMNTPAASAKSMNVKVQGDIFPGDVAPVLCGTKVQCMQWGFSTPKDKRLLINARCESAGQLPSFREAFFERRCLIPASGYYEWQKAGKRKQRLSLRGDKSLLYMAGLYHLEPGKTIASFVVLTKNAQKDIMHIHDRMPVFLDGDLRREWLTGYHPEDVLKRADTLVHVCANEMIPLDIDFSEITDILPESG